MTHHFFLPASAFVGEAVHFPIDSAHQIERVLRMADGERVIALDNKGFQYQVRLQHESGILLGVVETKQPAMAEPVTKIWLYMSLCQREKFEWILQKGTELGVSGFVPMITQRTLAQETNIVEKKRERWETILKEAAEQCKRGRIPLLAAAMKYPDALADARNRGGEIFMPHVRENTPSFQTQLRKCQADKIAIFIGPEGGFTETETDLAIALSVKPVSLGSRVLRMETAALAAVTMAMSALGDMD